ncbi:MAG: protein kinase [Planctomycetes bacterium]|jgi:serine/threonine protein kinase|nr:protein kinase [Planctomycetota bacterium]
MDAAKTRILVQDDEEPIRLLMTDLLEMQGYEVITASNGVEGVRRTFADAPALVITDILMPEMTGLAYLKRIRAEIPPEKLPVIVVSALSLQENIVKGFEAGATDYLVKPFHHSELLARVHIALHRKVDSRTVQFVEREPSTGRRTLAPGGFLDLGKYRILEEIGHGGMGRVYRAKHAAFGSEFAVKVLDPKQARTPSNVMRFLREVRIATLMDHPHIVRVYDMGLSAGQYYYAMESLPRHSLFDEVESAGGGLEEGRVRRIGLQLASALAYMHERGYVHRDVKPDNVLFAAPGQVKLVDFGLACAFDDSRLTQEGTFIGTPGYVAPENIQEFRSPDAMGDVYSLGATLYFAAAGKSAFSHRKGSTQRLHAQIHENPIPLGQANPSLSPELGSMVTRMMSRDPARRFTSMREVLEALEAMEKRAKAAGGPVPAPAPA